MGVRIHGTTILPSIERMLQSLLTPNAHYENLSPMALEMVRALFNHCSAGESEEFTSEYDHDVMDLLLEEIQEMAPPSMKTAFALTRQKISRTNTIARNTTVDSVMNSTKANPEALSMPTMMGESSERGPSPVPEWLPCPEKGPSPVLDWATPITAETEEERRRREGSWAARMAARTPGSKTIDTQAKSSGSGGTMTLVASESEGDRALKASGSKTISANEEIAGPSSDTVMLNEETQEVCSVTSNGDDTEKIPDAGGFRTVYTPRKKGEDGGSRKFDMLPASELDTAMYPGGYDGNYVAAGYLVDHCNVIKGRNSPKVGVARGYSAYQAEENKAGKTVLKKSYFSYPREFKRSLVEKAMLTAIGTGGCPPVKDPAPGETAEEHAHAWSLNFQKWVGPYMSRTYSEAYERALAWSKFVESEKLDEEVNKYAAQCAKKARMDLTAKLNSE